MLPTALPIVYALAITVFRMLHPGLPPNGGLAIAANGLFAAIKVYGWVLALALAIVPGTHGPNRFGPPPGESPTTVEDVF